jgi:hypothetical protein
LSAEAIPAKRVRRCGQPPPARAPPTLDTPAVRRGLTVHFGGPGRSAVERRGKPIDDDRLDVETALLICHWYDTAVLN